MKLRGKVALVTGAGRGIGRGIAECMAKEGARVVIADINGQTASTTAAEMTAAGYQVIAVTADVTKADQVRAMVDKAYAVYGTLDVAVNNAGILRAKPLVDTPDDEWDLVMEANVKSVFLCCKEQAPRMVKSGGGAIINVASTAGIQGVAGLSNYCASKYAVVGFTSSIAREYARENLRINTLCPGIVGTDMWKGSGGLANIWKMENETTEQAWERNVQSYLPQGVPQTAEDMGELAVFLATAPHIVGQAIAVDGGYTSR